VSKGFVVAPEDGDRLRDSRNKFERGETLEGTGEDFVGSISGLRRNRRNGRKWEACGRSMLALCFRLIAIAIGGIAGCARTS